MFLVSSECHWFLSLSSLSLIPWGKLLDIISFIFCFDRGHASILLPCNFKPPHHRSGLWLGPEAQQPIEKGLWGFSSLFSENVEVIFQWCLKHTINTEERGGIHWFQGLFFSLLVWVVSSILYNKLLVLVPTTKRVGFRSTSLSVVPLS